MAGEQLMIGLDLSNASLGVVEVLCDEAGDENIFREIYRANIARPEVLKALFGHPLTPQDLVEEIAPVLQVSPSERKVKAVVREERTPAEEKQTAEEREKASQEVHGKAVLQKTENLMQKLRKMTVGEKVMLAMRGGKEIRGILIKDTSKEVVKKVMENPKMTESEVDLIAKNRSVPDEVLRMITKKKEWMKNYSIMLSVITNPKTPAGLAMNFVKSVKKKDLVLLEKNKNVSQAVRAAAKKYLSKKTPG